MANLTKGQPVKIMCDVQPGPFSGERLITIKTVHGLISGFAREEDLEITDGDSGYIRGVVEEIDKDVVTVRVQGSFFTTNGLMGFPQDIPLAA